MMVRTRDQNSVDSLLLEQIAVLDDMASRPGCCVCALSMLAELTSAMAMHFAPYFSNTVLT